eukprot:TRINITY_DN50888_c0_g1_i1.p1 TRINITY_DN50888_c0_g1~~TRINITY_DN50888_c0_g1_i1.p1  ORF type:complete len:610 (+),score=233.66 TRINITY_DN50888_c0_g1_i1:76-1830(+)
MVAGEFPPRQRSVLPFSTTPSDSDSDSASDGPAAAARPGQQPEAAAAPPPPPPRQGTITIDRSGCGQPRQRAWRADLLTELQEAGAELREVALPHNMLGDQFVAELAASASAWPQLTALDLSWNGISDRSAPQLGALVRALPGLRRLRLHHNPLSERGAAAVAEELAGCTALTSAHLGVNLRHCPGGQALGERVQRNLQVLRQEQQSRDDELRRDRRAVLQARERREQHHRKNRAALQEDESEGRKDKKEQEQSARQKLVRERNRHFDDARAGELELLHQMAQRAREARCRLDDEELHGRRMIQQELDSQRQQMLKAERVTRERILLQTDHRHEQEELERWHAERYRYVESQEGAKRGEIVSSCAQHRSRLHGLQRRRFGLDEQSAREEVWRRQEDNRREVFKMARSNLKDMRLAEQLQRGLREAMRGEMRARADLGQSEQRTRRELMDREQSARGKAWDATYAADRRELARVLARREAHYRLGFADLEEVERQHLRISLLLDVPVAAGARELGPEQREAAELLRQQHAAEFAEKSRARAVAQMEDHSVLHFEESLLRARSSGQLLPLRRQSARGTGPVPQASR